MARKIIIPSLKQREDGLTKLIDDTVEMKFNTELIKKYKRQLKEVKEKLAEERKHRKKILERRKLSKGSKG